MRGKRATLEDIDIKIEWVDPSTPEGKWSWDNGFRILARMIARAYMKEQMEKRHLQVDDAGHIRNQPIAGSFVGRNQQPHHSGIPRPKENPVLKTKADELPQDRLGFTVKEVARLLGLDSTSVYKAVKAGQIPSVKVGKRIVIPKDSLFEILSKASRKRG